MRLFGRLLALLVALLTGLAVGVITLGLHRGVTGAVVSMTTTLVVMWAIHWWAAGGAPAFAAGWLTALLLAVAGRGEGDYVVSADARGWLLVGFGVVVLVTGVAWARVPARRSDSGSLGAAT